MNAKVTYLDHSGFAVTTPTAILVFDYYRDPSDSLKKILNDNKELPVVFLVSHHHPDHFNNEIFDLAQNHKRLFVLSDDIFSKLVPDKGIQVAWLRNGDPAIEIPGGMTVKAYGSTDAGVSYAVTDSEGRVIFHAGDLNDWHWQDESTQHEVVKAHDAFTKILNRITDDIQEIWIAMFPVDTRLGTDFSRGAEEFTKRIKVDNFIPMHFWNKADLACDFKNYIPDIATTRCFCLDHPGHDAEIG